MTTATLANFLLWCAVVNYVILIVWFVAMLAAHDFVYKLHSRWFNLTEATFDGYMYLSMAIYKILVLVLNVVPFIALKIIG
jgi:hypothetical protein